MFRTENELTLPISGTGSAGMEACFVNLLEPGDTAIVGANGVFGDRMCEVARRCGAEVVRVEEAWGKPLDPQRLLDAQSPPPSRAVVAVVHAETSTGVENEIAPLRALRDTDTLLLVDTVTSLGGIPVEIDGWGVDASYSGTQKCLGVPPGLSPVTFSARALDRLHSRETPPQSWYLDLSLIAKYVGGSSPRVPPHRAGRDGGGAARSARRAARRRVGGVVGAPPRGRRPLAVGACPSSGSRSSWPTATGCPS